MFSNPEYISSQVGCMVMLRKKKKESLMCPLKNVEKNQHVYSQK